MLRQRSSEIIDRTCTIPPNWLSSRAHDNVRGVGADCWRKLHCEHGESVNRRGMQVRRKEFGPATKVLRAIRILVSVTAEDTM